MLALTAPTVYVLLTPTWMSAMTGYQSSNTPMLQVNDTNYVNAPYVPVCNFIIHDGHRVGLSDDTCVPMHKHKSDAMTPLADAVSFYFANYLDPTPPRQPRNVSSTFGDPWGEPEERLRLDPPVLNITLPTDFTFKYGDRFLYADDIAKRGVCQASPNRYQWGFSFHLTFTYLAVSTLLAVALYVVWLRSLRGQEIADAVFGDLKTAVVVSKALDEVAVAPPSQMSEKALQMLRCEQRVGIDVWQYVVQHESSMEQVHLGVVKDSVEAASVISKGSSTS